LLKEQNKRDELSLGAADADCGSIGELLFTMRFHV
jgi:hypothetical protein